jgi:hypothetical protein
MSLRLDRIQIITPIEDIGSVKKLVGFSKGYRNGKQGVWVNSNQVKLPYDLELKVSKSSTVFDVPELKIGFTGKILGENYPDLIGSDNIRKCLEVVHATKRYSFDIDKVLELGQVYKLDVAEHVKLSLTKTQRTDLEALVKKQTNWNFDSRGANFTIHRKNDEESLCIYDKEHEMGLFRNKEYVGNNKLKQAFDGLLRVEQKLMNGKVIRSRLGISDNLVNSVFKATKSPIVEFMKDTFNWEVNSSAFYTTKQKEAEMLAYIRQFMSYDGEVNWNDMLSDIKLNSRSDNASAATRTRKKYKDFYNELRERSSKEQPGHRVLNSIIEELEQKFAA